MKDLKQQFQEETNLSFDEIAINGVHLEYINWLEKRIEALNIAVVVNRRELLLDFADYSERDKTSETTDECVDNYLDSIK